MSKKHNGSGEHPKEEKKKILSFPSLAERDRIRREKKQREQEEDGKIRRAQGHVKPKSVPFFNFGNIPPFTGAMVGILFAIHVILFLAVGSSAQLWVFYNLGFIPGYFTGASGPAPLWAPASILTHMLIHGSWTHLVFNTVMMLAMGILFERNFGTRSAIRFFFLCGIAGAAAYFLLKPFTTVPLIGASGGISGLFGASLLVLMQQNRSQFTLGGTRGPLIFVLFWMVFSIAIGMITGTAWEAHTGGYLAGVGLLYLKQKRKINL